MFSDLFYGSDQSEAGEMVEIQADDGCPSCGSTDKPKLFVRGSSSGRILALRCRVCEHERPHPGLSKHTTTS